MRSQVEDLTFDQIWYKALEQITELVTCQFLLGPVRECMLLEVVLCIDTAIFEDFFHFLNHFFSVDTGKFVDKFVIVDAVVAVHIKFLEHCLKFIVIESYVHRTHLLPELREADLTV
jgi:hypothetical protein